jgi:hypothetical protein
MIIFISNEIDTVSFMIRFKVDAFNGVYDFTLFKILKDVPTLMLENILNS